MSKLRNYNVRSNAI